MSTLVRYLLLDASQHKLSVDVYSDLILSVQTVLTSGAFTTFDAYVLDLYLSGYTSEEIAIFAVVPRTEIDRILLRMFNAIETTSGYTDASFIENARRSDYGKRRIMFQDFIAYVKEQEGNFMNHGDRSNDTNN